MQRRIVEVTVRFEVEGDAEEAAILNLEDALRHQAVSPDAGGLGLSKGGAVVDWTVLDPEIVG